MIKKADILLFFIILAFGLAVSWWSLTENSAGEKAVVTVDGRLYGTYPLSEDQTVEIIQENGHHNDITIKDGQVSMTFSDCRNQICVASGAISQTKDTIVCLPNKVVVEIIGEKPGDVDIITGTSGPAGAAGAVGAVSSAEGGDADGAVS
ncbi:MAG: NusG domain II-containing protein [Firmicutes bacterium]|nr:NusG domain II-containing protein [Bacillota bacterium]